MGSMFGGKSMPSAPAPVQAPPPAPPTASAAAPAEDVSGRTEDAQTVDPARSKDSRRRTKSLGLLNLDSTNSSDSIL